MPVTSKGMLWSGRIMSGLLVAFLLLDGAIKLVPIAPVNDTLQQLGFTVTPELARGLGILTLACAILYAIPRTSILGAIVLTGYLGGAMAVQLRAQNPLFSHLLFGFYLGLLAWGGLYLRDARLREMIPWRR